jgi:hypothetical protein
MPLGSVLAGDKMLVIGDSLTKEYEVTFPGFDQYCVSLPVSRPGIDQTNPTARNWAEILHTRRNGAFDMGRTKDLFACPIPDGWDDLRLSGHEYNWAVAGATARFLRNFALASDLDEWESSDQISEVLNIAEFLTVRDWKLQVREWRNDMRTLLSNSTDSVVIFCGGNDLKFGNSDPAATDNGAGGQKISYGTIYSGDGTGRGNPTNLIDSIRKNIRSLVIDVRNNAGPNVPIVLCSVPHVGATPNVQADGFTNPTRTARCTAAIEELNRGLAALATGFNCGFADVYKMTKDLLDNRPFQIGGVSFINSADPLNDSRGNRLPLSTRKRYLFTPLVAPANDGFHPTTAPQAVIANLIINAFKTKYPTRFSSVQPLTSGEILWSVLGIDTDTGYQEAMAATSLTSAQRAPTADPDGDGVPNVLEYALADFNPERSDSQRLGRPVLNATAVPHVVQWSWRPRFADNAYTTLVCQRSTDLRSWMTVPSAQLLTATDGTVTASVAVPASGVQVYFRLRADVIP